MHKFLDQWLCNAVMPTTGFSRNSSSRIMLRCLGFVEVLAILGVHPQKQGMDTNQEKTSRIVVRNHLRLELRTKDRNVPVVELRSINCDGGSGTTGAWSKLHQ